jgi:hypothetical protein
MYSYDDDDDTVFENGALAKIFGRRTCQNLHNTVNNINKFDMVGICGTLEGNERHMKTFGRKT